MLKVLYGFVFRLSIIGMSAALVGCGGGTIEVYGSPRDIVLVQRRDFPKGGLCCEFTQCVDFAAVILSPSGFGRRDAMSNPNAYFGMSPLTGCTGEAYVTECGIGTMQCLQRTGTHAFGRIVVNGSGMRCIKIYEEGVPMTICNNTTIEVNVDGTSVWVTAYPGTTSTSLASQLASNINAHATLGTKLGAVASAQEVLVTGLQPVVDRTYSWKTSCFHPEYFASCAFTASLKPLSTMGTQPPLQ
jgi:hypothetical protein